MRRKRENEASKQASDTFESFSHLNDTLSRTMRFHAMPNSISTIKFFHPSLSFFESNFCGDCFQLHATCKCTVKWIIEFKALQIHVINHKALGKTTFKRYDGNFRKICCCHSLQREIIFLQNHDEAEAKLLYFTAHNFCSNECFRYRD